MKKLSIGITCYPTVGGSGIVASQLGSELAQLGHRVHFISYEPPFRLDLRQPNVEYHQVEINQYQLFKYPDYTLPLAVKMVEVAAKRKLDLLHVHYAVPHATAALLATHIAQKERQRTPHVVTTLHGTDITLLGRDPNLRPIIKYSIENSCGVTAVSESLRKETVQVLRTRQPIHVIHNFYRPAPPSRGRAEIRASLKVNDRDFLLIHMSNLRPVKRIPDVLHVLAQARATRIKLLILAGGPFEEYRPLAKKLGVANRLIVRKNVVDIENYINAADAGLYTSEKESFGMGVLETMSFGKPVVATGVGGVSEIVRDRKTGFLVKLGDVGSMARHVLKLASDPALTSALGAAARDRAQQAFSPQKSVNRYLDYYCSILGACACGGSNAAAAASS
ncbi:MAG TPA: N-acetyl-alpha-D-glucosaminyl L-malate synthase BshA [Bryobacteraceae bacterium]|nr:N-acetyl-alpha-D-glucosaminyl L-malate synthase BshA [Bryobacteraceae bacterium]